MKIKLNKGDTVQVLVGKDRGKTGKVEKVLPKKNMVLVSGVNMYKRHLKPQGKNKPGGIVDITKPLPVSKVALVCKKCNQPTRTGFLIDKSGAKIRICKKCKQVI
jgi:large subunit ribosomal protein L24